MDGGTGLDLDGHKVVPAIDHQIDLATPVVAPVVQAGHDTAIDVGLAHFGGDPRLEQRTSQGVVAQLVGGTNGEQSAGEAAVEEVELGRFDNAFSEVAVQRWQALNEVASFEYGEPGPRRVMRDAYTAAQARQMDHSGGVRCGQL